jgi:hypothetical protein
MPVFRRWVGRILLAAVLVVGCTRDGAEPRIPSCLFDGHSLDGWRVLSGSWSVTYDAIVAVGPKSRLFREGRCPASYRLCFEVAPHDSPEVVWAVAVPVGGRMVLEKGLFLFAGGPEHWQDAWQAVEVLVAEDEVRFAFPGVAEAEAADTPGEAAHFADPEVARQLYERGLRRCRSRSGLGGLCLVPEPLREGTPAFEAALARGTQCSEGKYRGVALVVPCTVAGDRDVPEDASARFRNVTLDPLAESTP